jgi:hypothetical protein
MRENREGFTCTSVDMISEREKRRERKTKETREG